MQIYNVVKLHSRLVNKVLWQTGGLVKCVTPRPWAMAFVFNLTVIVLEFCCLRRALKPQPLLS